MFLESGLLLFLERFLRLLAWYDQRDRWDVCLISVEKKTFGTPVPQTSVEFVHGGALSDGIARDRTRQPDIGQTHALHLRCLPCGCDRPEQDTVTNVLSCGQTNYVLLNFWRQPIPVTLKRNVFAYVRLEVCYCLAGIVVGTIRHGYHVVLVFQGVEFLWEEPLA